MIKHLLLTALILTINSLVVVSQSSEALPFQVNINHPPLSISQADLHEANTLTDLNRMFKPTWVKEYLWVEISSVQKREMVKVMGEDSILNQQQKHFLKSLDFPAPITVSVQYIPENNLTSNPPRNERFSFSVHPTKSAQYIGGEELLLSYLKENAIDKISKDVFQGYDLAILKFVINENGEVVDTSIYQSSKNDEVDALLYDVICNMSNWIPAEHESGIKVRQEFAFTIGNHENCMINTLNTINNMY